ncbi:hypothetical protein F4780DRAFT_130277 [Xylariomycetidae sp. FL0641]|nr:hypothetical protein F4780DRAFT_130277 [Xylariomycetidae sp. FL0641]
MLAIGLLTCAIASFCGLAYSLAHSTSIDRVKNTGSDQHPSRKIDSCTGCLTGCRKKASISPVRHIDRHGSWMA